MGEEGQWLMWAAMMQFNLSARAYHRTQSVKLARTIADLAESEEIRSVHLAEAVVEITGKENGCDVHILLKSTNP